MRKSPQFLFFKSCHYREQYSEFGPKDHSKNYKDGGLNCYSIFGKNLSLQKVGQLQFISVQSLRCVRLCYTRDYSTPAFPVHHQLPEPIQTHVHHVDDAIQPPYPLSSPSSPAFILSQHQGLFQ